MPRTVRILTTNDFFASFAPVPTSYGALPGGVGLRDEARRLRQGQPTIWADVGDMFHSGPLSQLSGGRAGYAAAAELGVDLATVGNHDLDHGLEAFAEGLNDLSYPIICANQTRLGLPPGRIVETPAGAVGFIGLTHPKSETMWHYSAHPERDLPAPDVGAAEAVTACARELRAAGAEAVVAILHDGVDALAVAGQPLSDPGDFAARVSPWAAQVDAVLAGHTLLQFVGRIGSTAVVQPYGLGCSIGVLDLELGAGERRVSARTVGVGPGGRWTGPGADLLDAAEADTLGHLPASLGDRSFGPSSLADFVADAVRRRTEADLAIVYSLCGQEPLDGWFAWWDAGRVSHLQLLQAFPWTDGGVVTAEISDAEARRLMVATAPLRHGAAASWGIAGSAEPSKTTVRLATTGAGLAAHLPLLLGRTPDWVRHEASFRACVSDALT